MYRFLDFVLNPAAHSLTRNGELVKIEPRTFQLLTLLVENSGRVVTKDELVEAIWAGASVSDATINSRISYARQAVGDDGQRQALIKTVSGVGFQFIGLLEPAQETAIDQTPRSPAPTSPGGETTQAPPSPPKRLSSSHALPKAWITAGALVLLAGLGIVGLLRSQKPEAPQEILGGAAPGVIAPHAAFNALIDAQSATDQKLTDLADPASFDAQTQALAQQGWRLRDIEVMSFDGEDFYAGLYERGGGGQGFAPMMLRHAFNEQRRAIEANGLSLVDFEISAEKPLAFSGVWAPGETQISLTVPRRKNAFEKLVPKMTGRGYGLVDVEVFVLTGADVHYVSLWRADAPETRFTAAEPEDAFAQTQQKMQTEGYTAIDVERLIVSGAPQVTAVWRAATSPGAESTQRAIKPLVPSAPGQGAVVDFDIVE